MIVTQANIFQKILEQKRQGNLIPTLRQKIHPVIGQINHLFYNPAADTITLHYPELVVPDVAELPLVRRIFVAYQKMKEAQKKVASVYRPSSLWEDQIRAAYQELIDGLKNNDI